MVEAENASPQTIEVPAEAAGQRLDQFLTAHLDGVSRSRVQLLMEQGDVLVDGEREKASMKLRGGERIVVTGEPPPAPLKATAEDIPLDVVYEDADLAVVNKPAGMMVHAGSGQNEDARSKGTLVNALLYRFKKLSSTGGDLRPGIVHRLDKDTSGLIVVAKNDRAHAALGEMFSSRQIRKTYLALVQGTVERAKGTINAAVGRDPVRRTRMTTQVAAQAAQSKAARRKAEPERLRLGRNFLHAARLEFPHPKTGKLLQLEAPLPEELESFLIRLEADATGRVRG